MPSSNTADSPPQKSVLEEWLTSLNKSSKIKTSETFNAVPPETKKKFTRKKEL